MRQLACAAVWGALLAWSQAEAAPANCDYYQDLLTGALCQNSIDLGLSIDNAHREIENGFIIPGFQASSKTTYNFLTLGASASVTPLDWLKVTLASSAIVQTSGYSSVSSGFFGTTAFSSSTRQSFPAYQTLRATATPFDVSTGNARYVIDVNLGAGIVPGTNLSGTPAAGNAHGQSEVFGGATATGQWHLPDAMYSVVGRAGLQIRYDTYFSETIVQPSLAVLLSNDVWGVAAGPSFFMNILAGTNDRIGDRPESVFLGGEIEAQPLRFLPIPVLRDLTLTVAVYHSAGQAAFVDTIYGKASQLDVDASLAWHFRY